MKLSKWETKRVLGILMDVGDAMLKAGAEIRRVEDTLGRMGKAYGALRTEVFAINSCIIASMVFPEFGEMVNSRRIASGEQTDLSRLEALNQLSRRVADCPLPPDALETELEKAMRIHPIGWKEAVGSYLASGGFCLFFGGTVFDALLCGFLGILIWALQKWFSPFCPNKVFFNFCASLVTGLVTCLICQGFSLFHLDKVIIGDIMLLIPGISITNAVRNMLVGDTMSGTMKLIESVLVATALACGYMPAMVLAGGGLL